MSNDYNQTDWEEDLEDVDDYLFTIDSTYVLQKICVSKDSYIMRTVDLSKFKTIRGLLDNY